MTTNLQTQQGARPYAQQDAILLRRIRIWVSLFLIGLVLSGITAFPLVAETQLLASWLGVAPNTPAPASANSLVQWIVTVRDALQDTDTKYPFLAYGYDWLAFAHLMIAVAFIGVLRDPVQNRWLIDWGLICCCCIMPIILICGQVRGIPVGWQLIDASFGVAGCWPLLLCRNYIRQIRAHEMELVTRSGCATGSF
jgi:hypothetical protein